MSRKVNYEPYTEHGGQPKPQLNQFSQFPIALIDEPMRLLSFQVKSSP